MRTLKCGGSGRLRVVIKGHRDLTDCLLPPISQGNGPQGGLVDRLREKWECAVTVLVEPGGRSDVFFQQLEGGAIPDEWHESWPGDPRRLAQAFSTGLLDEPTDVVVLSLQSELLAPVWRHQPTGVLWSPPEGWEQEWTLAERQWVGERFAPGSLQSCDEFRGNFSRLIRTLKDRCEAHMIVFNCSSIDPSDHAHNYHDLEDTFAVRVNRFNLALMELSLLEGISIVDADHLLAELGGERHIVTAGRYSVEANEALCRECARVLGEIGFFEPRPLVMQIGQRGSSRDSQARDAARR